MRTLGVYALGGRSFSFSVLRRLEAWSNPSPGPGPGPSPDHNPSLTLTRLEAANTAPLQPEWEVVAARDERLLGSEAFDDAVTLTLALALALALVRTPILTLALA